MAEFEIIGDENMAGNDVDDEEMDEATRAFLEEERVWKSHDIVLAWSVGG